VLCMGWCFTGEAPASCCGAGRGTRHKRDDVRVTGLRVQVHRCVSVCVYYELGFEYPMCRGSYFRLLRSREGVTKMIRACCTERRVGFSSRGNCFFLIPSRQAKRTEWD
jgi:hypothetical protein